ENGVGARQHGRQHKHYAREQHPHNGTCFIILAEAMEHWLACALQQIDGGDQHTAGRALLRRLLAAEGRDGEPAIALDANGKPHLAGPDVPAISIAHSADVAAAAVCHVGPVGIDIETHNSTRNWMGIAETYFGPRERALVAAQGLRAFYRIWTLRE